ncbi:MAG: hypothetical protein LBJ04_22705 [Sphingobacterium sp.]|jgi:hypothetical protein|nr:hypothetical protein [Sphingobacterium sp.]
MLKQLFLSFVALFMITATYAQQKGKQEVVFDGVTFSADNITLDGSKVIGKKITSKSAGEPTNLALLSEGRYVTFKVDENVAIGAATVDCINNHSDGIIHAEAKGDRIELTLYWGNRATTGWGNVGITVISGSEEAKRLIDNFHKMYECDATGALQIIYH